MFSSPEKKPQLNMLIKALWFPRFLQMHNKNESLSADLTPGQGALGPGRGVGWLPEPCGMYEAVFTVKCQIVAAAPPAGSQMLAGDHM